jgi:nicotinamidase-related amidase
MSALIIMNAQDDMINGTLPVHDALSVIPIINTLTDSEEFSIIVWVRSIFPYDHCAFVEDAPIYSKVMRNGKEITVMPPHCLWNSAGGRNISGFKRVFSDWEVVIGREADCTTYSAMDGEVRIEGWPTNKTLVQHLTESKINRLTVCGFLTGYGVAETVADARKRGFEARAELSACRDLI